VSFEINLDADKIGNNSRLNYSANQLLRMSKMEIKVYPGYSVLIIFGGSRGVKRPKIRTERVRNTDAKRFARSLANKFKVERKNIEVFYEDSTENKKS
jgi:hypothetical protein